jgi:hypothetical protein
MIKICHDCGKHIDLTTEDYCVGDRTAFVYCTDTCADNHMEITTVFAQDRSIADEQGTES